MVVFCEKKCFYLDYRELERGAVLNMLAVYELASLPGEMEAAKQ